MNHFVFLMFINSAEARFMDTPCTNPQYRFLHKMIHSTSEPICPNLLQIQVIGILLYSQTPASLHLRAAWPVKYPG